MAISEEEAIRRRRANLSRNDIKRENPTWSEIQVQDYLDKQQDIDTLSNTSLTLQEQVDQNTQTNVDQQLEIDSNTAGVNNNANNTAQNALDITAVTNNFNAHDASTSEHGVTGDNIGTGDFAQSATGGAVLLAALVNDAVDSTVSVDSPDAPAAAATYSQADTQANVDLTNELKADVNQLVTDLNAAITQLNDFIDKSKTAKQMSTV